MTEAFSFLNPILSLKGFEASWIPRLPDIDVLGDREFALKGLRPHHNKIIAAQFPNISARHHGEQIHGKAVQLITTPSDSVIISHPGVDGLITNLPGQLLAIYVADCAVIYLADPVTDSIALLHSGKKGTEANILAAAVGMMIQEFGTVPADLVCALSPCIRPPNYDFDIASTISDQAASLGISNFHDSCENTASDLDRHYSYRMEKGRTGRMLALLSLTNPMHFPSI